MTIMPGAYAAKQALLDALLEPALLAVRLDGVPSPETVPADVFFHPMTGLDGMELAHLLAPAGHSAMLVRGQLGAHSPRGSITVPQAVRLHVQSGALLWWQHAWGEDPRRLEAGDTAELRRGEPHGFLVLEDCLLYNLFTPALEKL